MNRAFFIVLLPVMFLTADIKGMEAKPEAITPEQLPECTRWETLRLRFNFYRKGYNLKERDARLTELVKNYDSQNVLLMHHLICANKTLIGEGSKGVFNEDDSIHSNRAAFREAIRSNNVPAMRVFLHNLDLKNGWPIGGFANYNSDLDEELHLAIETSEKMTKTLLDAGVNPLFLRKHLYGRQEFYPLACSKEPGCAYYKQAYKNAIKRGNKELRELFNK